ncbi:MAG: family 78 glycoside hydrolase catalytic domain [Clostridia bacterium]|nr:family 78 glycoside hydrolase catalytic domain [Clostridia bacterium]
MNNIFSAAWIKSKTNNKLCATDFFRAFAVKGPIEKATLTLTAHGTFVAWLNGARVGEDILAPGWTAYQKRLQYMDYDVTALLTAGENNLTVGVGRGWFFHETKWVAAKTLKYDEAALICALTIRYADGSEDVILSDESWQTRRSRIVYNDIYNGETVDLSARAGKLSAAVGVVYPKNILIPAEGAPVREQERIAGQKRIVTPKGETVIDFGQEVTGYVEFTAKAPRGTKITLRHFEMLDKDGNVYTENLRSAKEQFTVISNGRPLTVKPQYTFYGFRYIQVIGLQDVDPADFIAIAVHSEMKRTGYFACANDLLNRFAHNVLWGQKGNFLDVPTDCPQRDERLGWTGDCEMFCRTAAINYDVRQFYDKWYNDVAAEQHADGMIPHTVPNPGRFIGNNAGSPAWDDVATVLPWELYVAYGSKKRLRRHFPTMKKYVDGMIEKCRDKNAPADKEFARPWTTGGYGDWLSLEDLSREHGVGETDRGLIATAYLAYGLQTLIKASQVLGYDCAWYEYVLTHVRRFFRDEYMENGRMKQDLQTAIVLALIFDLTDDPAETGKQLAENVRRLGRLTTGFIGATHLLDALTMVGEDTLAVDLLLRTEYPSWLYAVTMGATTIWERWNGMYPDGHFASPGMNSFNHYAYGSVFSWMFRRLAGIAPVEAAPGYAAIRFAPAPDDRIPWVRASLDTDRGTIASDYEKTETGWRFTFTVPAGSTATAELFGKTYTLHPGENTFCVE